jgi:hypothetical protein
MHGIRALQTTKIETVFDGKPNNFGFFSPWRMHVHKLSDTHTYKWKIIHKRGGWLRF